MLLFEAYRYTTIAVATLCYYMAPVLLIAFSPLLFKEKLTGRQIVCVLLAALGMVLVSGVLDGGGLDDGAMTGIALALDVGEFGDELPALGALDAMGDGEVSAFLRLGVIFAVGVEREEYLAIERACGFDDRGGDPLGLGGAERAGHEVVLHIDDDEISASHGASLHGDGVCVMVAEAEGRAASYRCAVSCRSCGERS